MQFLLKKCLSFFLSPTILGSAFICYGIFLGCKSKEKCKRRNTSFVIGVSILFLFSWNPFVRLLTLNLETMYPSTTIEEIKHKYPFVSHIVVLGGGHFNSLKIPLTDKLSHAALSRLIHAIYLLRHFPNASLVLTEGDAHLTNVSGAEVMSQISISLGVSNTQIIKEEKSKDTYDHIKYLFPILQDTPFILVTSAIHMPRAMKMFIAAGMSPIPQATDSMSFKKYSISKSYLPSVTILSYSNRIIHEYLGIVWAFFRGQI